MVALEYQNYGLNDWWSSVTETQKKKINPWKKNINTEMMNHELKSTDPIQILVFLMTFQDAYDSTNIHERAAKWLFWNFIRDCAQKSIIQGIK